MPPHSKTVRGTLDNPKTKDAINHDKQPPQTDPVSLKSSVNDHKNDSEPSGAPSGFDQPADTYGLKKSAPSAPSSFEQAKSKNNERSHADNYGLKEGSSTGSGSLASATGGSSSPSSASKQDKDDIPHSKKVRGTLANTTGNKVNKTMLGDPAGLKSETSKTGLGKDVERGTAGETNEDAAEKRAGGKSKL